MWKNIINVLCLSIFLMCLLVAGGMNASAQGTFSAQSSASFVTSVSSSGCGYAGQSCLFGRSSMITIYPATGGDFPATCSAVVPVPDSEEPEEEWDTSYCDVRVKFSAGSASAFAKLLYVSPTQINLVVPAIWTAGGSGATTGSSRYVQVQDGTNSWASTHVRYDDILNIAVQTFVAYRYNESNVKVPYPNAVVYGWNGSAYVPQRTVVDTACTADNPTDCPTPTPVPKSYNGQPTIIAFFTAGGWDKTDNNPSGETVTLNIDSNNHNLTMYYVSYFYEQVNWTVPSTITTGSNLVGKFDHTGLQYPSEWYLKFQ